MAPSRPAEVFSELFTSAGLTHGFPSRFLVSPWKGGSPAPVKAVAMQEERVVTGEQFLPSSSGEGHHSPAQTTQAFVAPGKL